MKILVAPLDWGLGHATRCIPIIKYLLEQNCEVIICADGRALQLLQKEFSSLEFVVMPGYNISYPKNGSMILKMILQIPKILSAIKREHKLLKKIISEKKIDAVISDNRFGLWVENIFSSDLSLTESKNVPCVFITHQIMVKSSLGEKFIHLLNKNYISKFSECWIPDYEGENNLSGELSHKFFLPKNAKYIGALSRFASYPSVFLNEKEMKYEMLIILSGPEPQRTLFEKKIIEQLDMINKKVLIVQGITEKNEMRKISENVKMISHLTSEELQKEIISSEIILSRPGYSTVMDLAVLGKKAIFVPTPGQTEQEYLANYFLEKKIAYSVTQKKFDIKTALKESDKFTGFIQKVSGEEFKKVVDVFLSSL
ncbi:MAG: glycosyltransferase family protein [Bacteroidota bacterium]